MIESRGTNVRLSEGNISVSGGKGFSRARARFVPAPPLRVFQRGKSGMIKLPIDSHLFSSLPLPPNAPPSPLAIDDGGHRCYGRPQNENNSRKAACASIYILYSRPHSPVIGRATSLTRLFCQLSIRIRLSNMRVGFV